MTSEWTYGAELEWPDVDVRQELPDGWAWSRTDATIVNSDGVANDPLRKLVFRGGELNTPPCPDPDALGADADYLRRWLKPGYNYRSNLHIHIAAPELGELDALKRVAAYTREHLPRALGVMDSLDGLLQGLTDPEEIAAAERRRSHSERSRHYFIPEHRHATRMEAPTLEDFLAATVPFSEKTGTPQYHLLPREAVNFLSLRKHGTVEFRCFAGDANAENVHAAASFARDWLRAALDNSMTFALPYFWQLPQQAQFNLHLERGWEWTNFRHNKRDVVRQRLRDAGKLEHAG